MITQPLMKYVYWSAVLLVIALGLGLAVSYSLEPHSVPKIKFSQVDHAARFGEAVLQRMREEVRENPLVFLGVMPGQVEDLELWKGFLDANQEPGSKYDFIIVEPQLPYIDLIPAQLKIDIKEERPRFVEGVKKALAEGLRVAVIVPSIYASHLLPQNPADLLKNQDGLQFISFSVVKYPLTSQQEKDFEPRCSVDKEDRQGTGSLGCIIRTKARLTYRKKLESGKFSGLMDQTGEKDYLILFNRNGATSL